MKELLKKTGEKVKVTVHQEVCSGCTHLAGSEKKLRDKRGASQPLSHMYSRCTPEAGGSEKRDDERRVWRGGRDNLSVTA
jgi:hypothetical protein